MALFFKRLERLYFFVAPFFFFYFSKTTLGAKNTPFVKTRQASNSHQKYIIAFKSQRSKKLIDFNGIKKEAFSQSTQKILKKTSLLKIKPLVVLKSLKDQSWRGFLTKNFNNSNSISNIELFELSFTASDAAQSEFNSLEQDPDVLFIEKDSRNIFQISSSNKALRSQDILALSFRRYFSWWQEQVNFPEFLNLWKKSEIFSRKDVVRPVVAILDSGLDYNHPSVSFKKLWKNPRVGELGCGLDLYGCDTTESRDGGIGLPNLVPFGAEQMSHICLKAEGVCEHGTQVASLVVGERQGLPNLGLCPHCQLLTLKVVSEKEGEVSLLDSSIIRALKYVALSSERSVNPVRLINISFGKYHKSKAIALLLYYLRKEYNILTIAAAGNESSNKKFYPAALPYVLAVGASDSRESLVSYSNKGSWINLVAPGGSSLQGITVAIPGGGEAWARGTSLSAPIVTGAAGFLLSLEPELTADELEIILLESTKSELGPFLNMEDKLKFLLSKSYQRKKTDDRQIEPLCGQIIGFSSNNKFHLKSLSIWFILFIPILCVLLIRPHEVKL